MHHFWWVIQGTANMSDEEDCDEYLDEAIQMLDVLGLDIITHKTDDEDVDIPDDLSGDYTYIPDGKYYLKRKLKRMNGKTITAEMQVNNGRFIVLRGSVVCEIDGPGLMDSVLIKREEAMIDKGVLKEDIILDSPSAAGSFVIGAACNGWMSWKCEDGKPIDIFREK